jgi:hypothetical protein
MRRPWRFLYSLGRHVPRSRTMLVRVMHLSVENWR